MAAAAEAGEERARVLFVCTHNSARSQMAEGMLRNLAEDRFEVHSAGTEATHVRRQAIKVMDEIGVDISGQESKTLERYLGEPFDYVITVCDEANEACPFFPGATNRLHWSFEDPSRAEDRRSGDLRSSEECEMRSGSASSRNLCRRRGSP